MKTWFILLLSILFVAPSAHAQWLRNAKQFFRLGGRMPSSSVATLAQKKVATVAAVTDVAMMRAISRAEAPTRAVKVTAYNYHLSAVRYFPELSAKKATEVKSVLDRMIVTPTFFLRPENLILTTTPEINKPYGLYMQATMADMWQNWIAKNENNPDIDAKTLRHAKAMQAEVRERFTELYEQLPEADKDLAAQVKRISKALRTRTTWDDATVQNIEEYLAGVMRPFTAHQKELTPEEFLRAYDILAVGGKLAERFESRTRKGQSTNVIFTLNEAIQRVITQLKESSPLAEGSEREKALAYWHDHVMR